MDLIGLDLKTAKEVLHNNSITDYLICYKTTKDLIGLVVETKIGNRGKLSIYIGVRSMIKDLPSNFQKNESLENFLMIFQHFNAQFDATLDNIHNTFNPMATDRKFLFWLSSWFSLELGAELPELRYRRLIKEIVQLYRWRGTKYGLETLLEIVSGVKPEIVEGHVDSGVDISDSVDFYFSESGTSSSDIGVLFPVSQMSLGRNVVKTIFSIVEKEKPAHINCRITFCPDIQEDNNYSFAIGDVVLGDESRL